MITGIFTEKVKSKIISEVRCISEISAVYGFGSFFRNESFSDIDILVIVDCQSNLLLEVVGLIRKKMNFISIDIECTLDVLILTSLELKKNPLVNMHELRNIWIR